MPTAGTSNTVSLNISERGTLPGQFGFVRHDPSLHHQLGYRQPAEPWKQPPVELTEAELRQRLAELLEAHLAAEKLLFAATEAHQRAELRRQACVRKLAAFADLDHRLTAATTAALRAGGDVDGVHEQFAEQTGARARATLESAAADGACGQLLHEMATASQRAGELARQIDIAVIRVLAARGHDLALQHAQKAAECRVLAETLLALDRMAAPCRVALSARVHAAMRDSGVAANIRSNPDLSSWTQAAKVLRADPMAEVEIAVPAAVVAPLPQPVGYGVTVVKPMEPIPPQPAPLPAMDNGDPHLTENEQHA
jgi:hypothetical protein